MDNYNYNRKFERSIWYPIWQFFTLLGDLTTFILFFIAWLVWKDLMLMIAIGFLNLGFCITIARFMLQDRLIEEIKKWGG